MNIDDLHRKIIAVAKANPPNDAVPYAFEKRVMAALAASTSSDLWSFWAKVLWRATVPCAAVMLVLGVFAWVSVAGSSSADSLANDLDNTVYAAFNGPGESW